MILGMPRTILGKVLSSRRLTSLVVKVAGYQAPALSPATFILFLKQEQWCPSLPVISAILTFSLDNDPL
jgi:hypothetical protein